MTLIEFGRKHAKVNIIKLVVEYGEKGALIELNVNKNISNKIDECDPNVLDDISKDILMKPTNIDTINADEKIVDNSTIGLRDSKVLYALEAFKGNKVATFLAVVPYIIDLLVVIGFIIIILIMMFIPDIPEYAKYSLTTLGTVLTVIISFHRGSSSGSKEKTKMLGDKNEK